MRIIAGKYKRTPIRTLEGEDITRPTRDMVKEALFSSIPVYQDTAFLDLFSGSGAIGLEALSRGAGRVVFNDADPQAVRIIKENLAKVRENREVYGLDYRDCLKKLAKQGFDIIYCDPPYAFNAHDELFYDVYQTGCLKKDGILIFEVRKDTDLKENYLDMHIFKEKRYGITKLLYYRKEEML